LTRLATLPTGAIATLVTARLALHSLGPAEYGAATILIALPLLLPFLHLGLATAVLNSSADAEKRNDLRDTLVRSATLLSGIAAALVLVGLLLTATDTWSLLVGPAVGHDFRIPGLIALCAFASTLLLGLGHDLLLGRGRTTTSILVGALQPLTLAGGYAAAVSLGLDSLTWLMVALAVSLVSSNGLAAVLGLRATRMYLTSPDRVPRAHKLALEAAPAIAVSVAVSITFQSGRWYLAHKGNGATLASYALAVQIWAPLVSIAYALGVSFWPAYRRDPENRASLWRRNVRLCAVIGVAVALMYMLALPIAFHFAAKDTLDVPWAAGVVLALSLFVWILHQASVMLFTSPQGLKRQAASATAMALVNVGILFALAEVASPLVAASALLVSMTFFALLPIFLVARRQFLAAGKVAL
jgi:O-antigen/teichoic acid export membrane protein